MPQKRAELSGWMAGLGRVFACWASRDDEGDDEGDDELDELNQAITMLGDAISLTSGHDPRLPSRLTDLATYLTLRFISSSDLKDIDEAITAARDAVNLIPDDNPDLAISLTVLAKALYKRYIKTSVNRDLNDAHTKVIMATEIAPEDLPELADMWILRGKIESSYEAQREARPLDRIRAVRKAIEDQWQWRTYRNSREAVEAAVELLSTVCSRYATRHEQLTAVRNTSGFAADVCSILLEESESHSIDSKPEQSLECLEQGRGLIIGYVTESRTEISNLRQKYRRKAQELEQLQHAASLRFHTTMDVLSQQRLLFERDEAASQIEPFLAGIRSLPGYERFLLPPSLQTLRDTASEGPIVIVNVTDISSAALIGRPSPWPVKHIELPDLDTFDIESFQPFSLTGPGSRYIGAEEFESTGSDFLIFLERLWFDWFDCVSPILEELQFSPPKRDGGDLPRIWWMGTGMASSLPFHAAGCHTPESVENAYSCVVFSYTPSLKTLRYIRERGNRKPERRTTLLVTMSTTPRANDLPGVATEADAIQETMHPVKILSQPDSATVMGALNEYSIAHLHATGARIPLTSPRATSSSKDGTISSRISSPSRASAKLI
ncbi:uncharacterized protein N7458_000734 [Penicillium daleae]|uniref:Uncharacterized protein n=1 Tax=Penicillium daleae TaxID=63821 RepID=A0AAD6CGQ5_9EURO|nr:uncharacterized protein N7458_000734 [Penicillium daleae]KAJ5465048.1 hypothetical protein N7458_000734 [Penicillium daleae]